MTFVARFVTLVLSAFLLWAQQCQTASTCTSTVSGKVPAPTTAPGVECRLVTSSLTAPRGIIFDTAGRLLVVDRGVGVKALTLKDDGGACIFVKHTKLVIANELLNHGIELSPDGKTLYASTVASVFSYVYDPATASVSGDPQTLVNGMFNTDHSTRTLLLSKKVPGTLVINRGSQSNIDPEAVVVTSGHAQVKAFNLLNITNAPYDFTTDGELLAWGVRNNVGVSEHPSTGGIWTVENSVDDISRDGKDFHQQNPGEKLNYMGTLLDNESPNQGSNFGYPQCFAAWKPNKVPKHGNLVVGEQFSINKSVTDAECQQRTAPRLVFDAHTAPLDIKFLSPLGRNAFISFHGSHDRTVAHGYKVTRVAFDASGNPIDPSTSSKASMDLVGVKNKLGCPNSELCFRPVGLAFDSSARLFFSSDATGEIYVIRNKNSSATLDDL